MNRLLDFLTFRAVDTDLKRDIEPRDDRLRTEEPDAAILTDKYPLDGADIESVSEYRLASLMQYPHY